MKQRFRSSLLWRFYAVGLAQLWLTVAAAIAIGLFVSRLSARRELGPVVEKLRPLANDPARLAVELTVIAKEQELQLSLYADDGQLIASSTSPPLSFPRFGLEPSRRPPGPTGPLAHPPREPRPLPPDLDDGRRGPPPDAGGSPRWLRALDLAPPKGPPLHETYARFDAQGYEGVLVSRPEHGGPSPWPLIWTTFAGLAVVGAGALLSARFIISPLRELRRTANELGTGAWGARTNLSRTDELGDVARAFDEMASRIQSLILSEKELLANVAHELRTPLARIRVALEIAGEGDAEQARASLQEIAVDLAELEDLIDDVLTAARFELSTDNAAAPHLPLAFTNVSTRSVAEQATERFRARHPSRALELELGQRLPEVSADARLLRRALDNLLENAHKYSPEPASPIVLSAIAEASGFAFEVRDRGIGIAPHDLPRLFMPFFRGERSRSRGTGGVGLGLTLSKRIVEAHGGRIEISSESGVGTHARIWLPALAARS